MMRTTDIVDAMLELCPSLDRTRAEAACAAVLMALSRGLGGRLVSDLRAVLPSELGAVLTAHRSGPGDLSAQTLYGAVSAHTGEPFARSIEAAQVALQVLGAKVGPSLRERIARELPSELARLIHPVAPTGAAHPPGQAGDAANTLAAGRAGSTHSLSETKGRSAPLHSAHPKQGQAESVGQVNPHGDTKLSSARGMTQEREHQTLAESPTKEKP